MKNIVIIIKIDSRLFEGTDEFLGLVFNEVNELKGIRIEKQKDCEYSLTFLSVHPFIQFYSSLNRSIPGEEAGKKPFVIRFRFKEIPGDIQEEILIEYMQKRYHAMHIPMVMIPGSHVWELRYPSADAYFASFIELIDLCASHMAIQTPIAGPILSLHSVI